MIFMKFVVKLTMIYSRIIARTLIKEVVKRKGFKVVNRSLKRTIKTYCKERFGKKAYWPYTVLYTEIRGYYIDGWKHISRKGNF